MSIYPTNPNEPNAHGENEIESNLLIQKYSSSFASICKKDIKFINILFPSFQLKSLTFYFTIFLIVIFLGTLILFFNTQDPLYISDANLSYIGLRRIFVSNKYEYYRLLTATVFHSNVWNLLVNSYYLMNIGRTIEINYGKTNYLGLILVSTIFGNIITCATTRYEDVEMGIGPILAGYAGVFLGDIIMHYDNITDKLTILGNYIFTFLLLFLTISFLPHNGSFFGDLGGIFGGLCFVYALEKNSSNTLTQKIRIILIILAVIYFVMCLASIIFFNY